MVSFLARNEADSFIWRKNFIQTFLERDLRQWGIETPSMTMLRFWTMLAHYHGQIWNAAEPARSLGVSEPTVRKYLDILSGVFMIRQLQPYHSNLKKKTGQITKDIFSGFRTPASIAGIEISKGSFNVSQKRLFMGRIRDGGCSFTNPSLLSIIP